MVVVSLLAQQAKTPRADAAARACPRRCAHTKSCWGRHRLTVHHLHVYLPSQKRNVRVVDNAQLDAHGDTTSEYPNPVDVHK